MGLRKARGQLALQVLADAYSKVFSGQGSDVDASIVLTDLGNFSGFYEVTSTPDRDMLAYREGMRAVYARIFNFVRMTDEERNHVAELVRLERQADELHQQGSINA